MLQYKYIRSDSLEHIVQYNRAFNIVILYTILGQGKHGMIISLQRLINTVLGTRPLFLCQWKCADPSADERNSAPQRLLKRICAEIVTLYLNSRNISVPTISSYAFAPTPTIWLRAKVAMTRIKYFTNIYSPGQWHWQWRVWHWGQEMSLRTIDDKECKRWQWGQKMTLRTRDDN